jgi:hypothetical protein
LKLPCLVTTAQPSTALAASSSLFLKWWESGIRSVQDGFRTHWRRSSGRPHARRAPANAIRNGPRTAALLRGTAESQSENLVPRGETSALICVSLLRSQKCSSHRCSTVSAGTNQVVPQAVTQPLVVFCRACSFSALNGNVPHGCGFLAPPGEAVTLDDDLWYMVRWYLKCNVLSLTSLTSQSILRFS